MAWSVLVGVCAAVAIGVALVGLPGVSAAEGALLTFQPDDVDEQWRQGTALRACAVVAPTSSLTVTFPDASTLVLAADSEDCWAFELAQAGLYDLEWTDAGGTNNVALHVQEHAPVDWETWLVIAMGLLFLFAGVVMRSEWLLGASILGLVGHIFLASSVFTWQFMLGLALFGIGGEFIAYRRNE